MPLVLKRKELTWWQKIYLLEIAKGLLITMRHLMHNFLHRDQIMTTQYPDEKRKILPNYRAEHRLMLRPDDAIRCTACMLCETACPSECIFIEAAESPDPKIEKYAKAYTIDLLRCVFCGFCVEACPCDAIRMDTEIVDNTHYKREDFILDIDYLKNNHRGKSPYSEGMY